MERIVKARRVKYLAKGQALTELAIFGSIMLFCVAVLLQYGLDANYQQKVQMEAFRKAQKIAFYKDGPGSAASLVLVKDKPFPDPRDQWGYAEQYPVAGSGNVVWNSNLQGAYVDKYSDTPVAGDLPAMYFEIDGATSMPSQAQAEVPTKAGDKIFGFYTSSFKKIACPNTITVVFSDPKHKKSKTEYYEFSVKKSDIKVMHLEGTYGDLEVDTDTDLLMSPYFEYDGLKYKITDADVDGDGKLEQIIATDSNKNLLYIDSHDSITKNDPGTTVAGSIDIDTDYTNIAPGDKVDGVELTPEYRQGMIGDSTKTIQHNGSKITKSESNGDVSSSTSLNATQTIVHKIRLNNSSTPIEVQAQFTADGSDLYGPNWSK